MSQSNAVAALVTGGARRIGAEIVRHLHGNHFNVIIHYNRSHNEAQSLAAHFNSIRADSATALQADLNDVDSLLNLAKEATNCYGRLDLLVNNASSFSPTPLGETDEKQWNTLFNSNAKAPFFLSQALIPELKKRSGSIINMIDIYGERPLENHTLYCMAKSALAMMTRSLAKELGPDIRVNGVAPGAILWPEQGETLSNQNKILDKTCLKRLGQVEDIIKTIEFIYSNKYLTGQIINIDGGRSVNM
ncbi:MAG: pteridine reductase [Pseudomonadales bacterium]|nr:pteridine reductase [Pseudomonadales bacterium]